MDLLSPLFDRFTLSARVFYSGALCTVTDFDTTQGIGILHVLRSGRLRVKSPPAADLELSEPALLFYRQPVFHRFEPDPKHGADLVCAFIEFGAGISNPLLRGMPDMVLVHMSQMPGVAATLALLFDEAFAQRAGRQAGINRLVEFFVVLLLRHTVQQGLVKVGVLAALADQRLSRAMTAMHAQPEIDWSLETLAASCGMSRARFAVHFRDTVGETPLDYLTDWRMAIAQTLLRRGKSLKMVAPMVGYSNSAAFARVFAKRVGRTPVQWLEQQGEPVVQHDAR